MRHCDVARVNFSLLKHHNKPITQGKRFSIIIPFHNRYLNRCLSNEIGYSEEVNGYCILHCKNPDGWKTQLNKLNIHLLSGQSASCIKVRKGGLQFAVIDEAYYKKGCTTKSFRFLRKCIKYGVALVMPTLLDELKKEDITMEKFKKLLALDSYYRYDTSKVKPKSKPHPKYQFLEH
ncbi:hypothetical protein AKO1_002775, partial [Acrasis kona]